MRRGALLLGLALLAAALAAAAARADSNGATTTTGTTTTTTTTPAYAPLPRSSLGKDCVGAGDAAIARPARAIRLVGTPAASAGPSAYPAGSPILTFDVATAKGSRCRSAGVTLNNLSLFDGAVTAASVQATDGKGTVTGLAVGGAPVSSAPGASVPVGDWGMLRLGAKAGRLSAPLRLRLLKAHGPLPAGTTIFVAFAALRAPTARTTKSGKPSHPASGPGHHSSHKGAGGRGGNGGGHHHAAKHHGHKTKSSGVPQPLKAVPSLGYRASAYVFPVDGGASYIDTYGANRSDIYDGWHHGDDLFAPLGTPLLAVANGTLTLVGWNEIGGWRLWLTDGKGNSFYYAHLAGYSERILHNHHVHAGQVVGFLGHTGDAFTTTPHLHFEIHPHQFTRLGYDGAVDPTRYLQKWRVVTVPADRIPQAATLRAPGGTPRQEAVVVWHQLLQARHLGPDGTPLVGFATTLGRALGPDAEANADSARRVAAVRTAAQVGSSTASDAGPWALVVLALALAASIAGGGFFTVRRRRRATA